MRTNGAFGMSAESDGSALLRSIDERGKRMEDRIEKLHKLIVGDGVLVGLAEGQRDHEQRIQRLEGPRALPSDPDTTLAKVKVWAIWGGVAAGFLSLASDIIKHFVGG